MDICEKKLNSNYTLKIEESPDIQYFKTEFLDKKIPVIIDKQMEHWPAMKKWRLNMILIINLSIYFHSDKY